MGEDTNWSVLLDTLADVLAETGGAGWLVGGCLRDALLGIPVRDVDIALTEEPLPVAERLAQRAPLAVARLGHGTIRLVPRYSLENYLDLSQLQGADILADLARRDFTVNAISLPLMAREEWLALMRGDGDGMLDLIDPFDGRRHLLIRRLVAVSAETFRDDPGRIIRAARLRARLGLLPDAETTRLAREATPQLRMLSPDRQREEMALLLALPQATDGVALLDELGALPVLYMYVIGDAAAHALAALRQLDRLMGVNGGGEAYPALHDWSMSDARRVSLRMHTIIHARAEHDEVTSAPTLWQEAQAVLDTEDDRERFRAARMLFWEVGKNEDMAVDALLVASACMRTRDDQRRAIELAARANAVVEMYIHHRDRLIPPPLLRGKDLISALGISGGPALGRLLRAVRLAQLADEISNREEALSLARRLKETHPAEFPSQ